MVERNIPRDITKYEAKLLGGFTTRQLICFLPGAALAICAGVFLRAYLGELAYLVAVVVAMPFFLCGAWKPYGLPLEKFAKQILISMFLAPTKRKFVIKNTTEKIFPMNKHTSNVSAKKALKYKSKDANNASL